MGNANNFISKELCQSTCKGEEETTFLAYKSRPSIRNNRKISLI